MKTIILFSSTLLFLCNLKAMEKPTVFDRLGLSESDLESLKRKSPVFAAKIEGLKKVKCDSKSDEFYSVPAVPQNIAAQYWAELQKLDSFPWADACCYAIRNNDEPSAIIARYGKTLVAKVYAMHKDAALSHDQVKREFITALREIHLNNEELSYIFTGRNIRVTPELRCKWIKQWYSDIKILLDNNIPTAVVLPGSLEQNK